MHRMIGSDVEKWHTTRMIRGDPAYLALLREDTTTYERYVAGSVREDYLRMASTNLNSFLLGIPVFGFIALGEWVPDVAKITVGCLWCLPGMISAIDWRCAHLLQKFLTDTNRTTEK